ncbi:hypothetical protein ELQ90_16305 [Labedella phragmitis]|uniref:Uncharacterized protein n=2 Tax=Labedella TaxID=390250 RepID=A0A3S4DRZ2_9MICO|nr:MULTISPECIES: hypothetical protein [Labedella]RWZ46048.1 hypothetical protein ELQ90_16305 [Labedella phragmitis]RWZ54819.1 hypothetical protein ELQ92_16025 [Labedella populi]
MTVFRDSRRLPRNPETTMGFVNAHVDGIDQSGRRPGSAPTVIASTISRMAEVSGRPLSAPGHQFPWRTSGISAQALRTGHLIREIYASGGDNRGVSDLFGIGVDLATRNAKTLEQIDPPHQR